MEDCIKIKEFEKYELYISSYCPDYIIEKARNTTIVNKEEVRNLVKYEDEYIFIDVIAINQISQSIYSKFQTYQINQFFINTLFLKEVIASLYLNSSRLRKEKSLISESLLFSLGYCFYLGVDRNKESDRIIQVLASAMGYGNEFFSYWSRMDSYGVQLRFLELLFCYGGQLQDLKHIRSLRDVMILLSHPLVVQLNVDRELDMDVIWDKLEDQITKMFKEEMIDE